MSRPYQPIRAPRSAELSCKSWPAEAALRLLQNSLDPDVASAPEQLVAHGGNIKVVRDWDAYDRICACLKNLGPDETLLIQSGKPVAVFKTTIYAPRVLMANSLMAPAWATADDFRVVESQHQTLNGGLSAASWLYFGVNGVLATAFETYSQVAATHFGGTLKGKLVVTAGLGNTGTAQVRGAVLNGATVLVAEADAAVVEKRVNAKWVDEKAPDLNVGIDAALSAKSQAAPKSVAVVGLATSLLARLKERGITPDVVTDMTGTDDLRYGYVPDGMSVEDVRKLREMDPGALETRAADSVLKHLRLIMDLKKAGAVAFEFGNNLRGQAELAGAEDAFEIPGFAAHYLRPQFALGRVPLTFVILSGSKDDVEQLDTAMVEDFVHDTALVKWIEAVRSRPIDQGLPVRGAWLRLEDTLKLSRLVNKMVRDKVVEAPVVIARDWVAPYAVASPFREMEQMLDHTDPVADWPVLGALLNTACGATLVSIGQGGTGGIGYSVHATMAVVANGSPEADARITRVFSADPALGVVRYVQAGEPRADVTAKEHKLQLP